MEDKYILLTEWEKHHDWPGQNSMRWKIFKADRDENDLFRGCYVRAGNRILINETKFFKWIEEENKLTTQKRCRVKSNEVTHSA